MKIYRFAYSEETAAIDSLLNDLGDPKKLAHLETINAVGWVQELDRDNQAFEIASNAVQFVLAMIP